MYVVRAVYLFSFLPKQNRVHNFQKQKKIVCSGLVSWSAILWFDKNLCRYFIFLDLIKRRIIIVVGDGFEAAAMVIELVVIAYTTSTNLF